MDLIVPSDHRVNPKEAKKDKISGCCLRTEIIMEHESDCNTIRN